MKVSFGFPHAPQCTHAHTRTGAHVYIIIDSIKQLKVKVMIRNVVNAIHGHGDTDL